MKAHTKQETARFEKMYADIVRATDAAKEFLESEKRLLVGAESERNAIPMSRSPSLALCLKLDRLRYRVQHAEWLFDKACSARHALREFAAGGQIDL